MGCYQCGDERGDRTRLCPTCRSARAKGAVHPFDAPLPSELGGARLSRDYGKLLLLLIGIALAVLIYYRLIGNLGYSWTDSSSFKRPDGITVSDLPVISSAGGKEPWKYKGATITPQHSIVLKGLVLGTGTFGASSPFAQFDFGSFIPVDLFMGWGPMSDASVLRQIKIRHGNRYAELSWQGPLTSGTEDAIRKGIYHNNIHPIPATAAIEAALRSLEVDEIATLTGYLVRVDVPGFEPYEGGKELGARWAFSGACFVMWVDSIAK